MNLLEFLTDVAQRADKKLDQQLSNGETLKQHLLRGFNLYNKDFNNRFLWPWRWKDTSLQTIPNYTTGTVTVTKDSRTVTVVNGTPTSSMVGRILKLTRDTEMYEIVVVSGQDFILSQPYIGDSGSGLGYLVWQKYYLLDPDVPYIKHIRIAPYPYGVSPLTRKDLDLSFINGYNAGYPEAWALAGIDRSISTYSTGTITVTKDSRTLTGSDTIFIGNVFGGSKIVAGSNNYNIETIDTNTQITMIQNALSSVVTINTRIESTKRTRIMFSSTPDPAINLYIWYPKKQYNLLNDNDETELWEGMEHVLTDVLYGYFLEKLTDSQGAFNWLKIYRDESREAWQAIQEMNPIENVIRIGRKSLDGYRRTLYS